MFVFREYNAMVSFAAFSAVAIAVPVSLAFLALILFGAFFWYKQNKKK